MIVLEFREMEVVDSYFLCVCSKLNYLFMKIMKMFMLRA